MNKTQFISSLKGKSSKALIDTLRKDAQQQLDVDPDFLSLIIDDLRDRTLTEEETRDFEYVLNTWFEEDLNEKVPHKEKPNEKEFSEEELNRIKPKIATGVESGRYRALKTVTGIISIIGYIYLFLGVVSFFTLVPGGRDTQILTGIGILFCALFFGILLLAFSNLIAVFIDIERNTGITARREEKLRRCWYIH